MKLVRLFLCCIIILNLSACSMPWSKTEAVIIPLKKDFVVSVQPISKSSNGWYITKSSKILGSSEIILTSQTAGRVTQITTKIGQNISINWRIAKLEDTNGALKFGYQKSLVAIDSANNNYDISSQNLEKQINDAKLNLDKNNVGYQNTLSDADKQIEKLNRDVSNNDISNISGTLYIQLAKLQKDFDKAKLDQQTKLKSDDQTISNTILSAKNIYTDLNSIYQDTYVLWDNILQPKNTYNQRQWLGAKDSNTKNNAYNQRDLFAAQSDIIKNIWNNITNENLADYMTKYRIYIWYINDTISSLKNAISNSVAAGITQAQLDSYAGQITALQSRASGILSNITSQLNSSNTFLNTYIDNQNSLTKQIELLESQISLTKKQLDDAAYATQNWLDRTKIWLNTQIENTRIWLDSAQSNYDFAKDTKDNNLQTIKNQLKSSQIWLAETVFNMSKFDIKSPIKWIIADVYVDLWQDVSPGAPIAKIVSEWQELEIFLSETEKNYVKNWDYVILVNSIGTGLWQITQMSPIADKNGNYKVIVSVKDWSFDVWSFVDVRIPLSDGWASISVNNISILDNWYGSVILRDGSWFVNQKVRLWNMFGDSIQIQTDIPSKYLIVTSDISNYDPEKMNIKIKTQ